MAFCCVEGVGEARALDGLLLDAVHDFGRGDAGDLEQRGHDVDVVNELLAQAALVLDACRPRDDHVLVGAAEPGGVLLEPVEGRVEGPRPARRHVVVGEFGAPGLVELHLHVHRRADAVEERDLAERAFRPAFGAGAVVAVLVDDQRVVELAQVLERLDHPADLVVVVGHVGGEHLDLPDEELLRLGRELVPGREDVVGPGRQLQSCGITPSFFWFAKMRSRSFS